MKKALDLFCGAGGATKGLQMAGFHVTGIDIKKQPHYCGDAFIQADALNPPVDLRAFDFIWASPPCQFFTQMRASWKARGVNDGYKDILTPTLSVLGKFGRLWVVENVVGAKQLMPGAITLHGAMFNLRVHRPRLFKANFLLLAPPPQRVTKGPVGVYDNRPRGKTHHRTRRCATTGKLSEMRIARTLEEAQEAMGMNWADWHGTKEAIPPAYSHFIGKQAMEILKP